MSFAEPLFPSVVNRIALSHFTSIAGLSPVWWRWFCYWVPCLLSLWRWHGERQITESCTKCRWSISKFGVSQQFLPKEWGTRRRIFAWHTLVRRSPRAVGSEEEQGELCLYSCANRYMRRVKKKGVICTCWGLYRLNAHTGVETATQESFRGTVASPASPLIRGWSWLIAFILGRFPG